MESKVRLDIDSNLAATPLRIGTSRWGSARSGKKLDYERVEYREAKLQLRDDGSLSLFVEGRTIDDAEWYEFPIPPGAVSGQRLDGEACFFVDIGPFFHTYPAWIDGKLTLSSLPRAVGETVNFDLSLQLASGWQFHASGPLKVKAATN